VGCPRQRGAPNQYWKESSDVSLIFLLVICAFASARPLLQVVTKPIVSKLKADDVVVLLLNNSAL
jgi:hypothetical protein